MAENKSGTFNLWGFFLLHLSRYVAITFSVFLYLLANAQRSLGQLYHPADCLSGSSELVTREHRPLLLAARCVEVAEGPLLILTSGTLEDVPPMVLAFLGGFLQQLLGPRKMLLAAGLPGLLSWLVVVVPAALKVSSSHTVPFLLMSRCTFCTFQSFIFSKLYFCPNSQNTCRSLQLLLDGQRVHGGHSTQPSCRLLQTDRGDFDLFITNFHAGS